MPVPAFFLFQNFGGFCAGSEMAVTSISPLWTYLDTVGPSCTNHAVCLCLTHCVKLCFSSNAVSSLQLPRVFYLFYLGISPCLYLNSAFNFSFCFSLPILNCNCLWSAASLFFSPIPLPSHWDEVPHSSAPCDMSGWADDRINLQVSPSFFFLTSCHLPCPYVWGEVLFLGVMQSFARFALSNLNYFRDSFYIRRYFARVKTFKFFSFKNTFNNSWIQ